MIKINIQTKGTAWIATFYVKIKDKEHTKKLKGLFENEKEIIETIFSNLKTKEGLVFHTNNSKIKEELEILHFTSELKDDKLDFSEIIEFKELEDPTIPTYLEKGYEEICIYDTDTENGIAINAFFVKAYLYFKENEDKIKELKLLRELKEKGIYDKNILIEDILVIIEESLIN